MAIELAAQKVRASVTIAVELLQSQLSKIPNRRIIDLGRG